VCNSGYSGVNCGMFIPESNTIPLVVGTSIGAGFIALIVILICLALAGGGGFAYAQAGGAGGAGVTANNPLYVGTGNSGVNPLHKEVC